MKAALDVTPTTEPTRLDRDFAVFAVAFIMVALVIIAPLAVIDTPLLTDYPNHVARMHVIGNVNDDAFLQARYDIRFDFLPNIVMDLIVPWLAQVLPQDVASRIFLGLCLLSTLVGVAWLHRTLFNQWSLFPLFAALFAYHGSLIAGLANFSLAIALVPAALAAWIKLEGAGPVRRFLLGSGMALGLFFCHLVAFGAYGLLVLGFELGRAVDRLPRSWAEARRIALNFGIAALTGVLPLLLYLRLVFGGDGGTALTALVFGNVAWKLKAALAPLANYSLPLDLLSFALIAGLAAFAWRAGWLEVERRMQPGLILLAVAFVLAPKAIGAGGVFDQRLAVLLALMLVACTRVDLPRGPLRMLLPAALAALFLLRMGVLTEAWIGHRADLAEMRRALDMVEPGSRLLVVRPERGTAQRLAPARHRVFHHAAELASLPTLAVIEKSAFVSTLYALPGQQPLALKPPFNRLGGRGPVDMPTLDDLRSALRPTADDPPVQPQIQDWTQDFDYVVMLYGYGPNTPHLAGELPLEPLLDGDILDLFQVGRPPR